MRLRGLDVKWMLIAAAMVVVAVVLVGLGGVVRADAASVPTLVVDGVEYQGFGIQINTDLPANGWFYNESCVDSPSGDGTLDVAFSASVTTAGVRLFGPGLPLRGGVGSAAGSANIDVAATHNPRQFAGSFSFDFGPGTTITGTFASDPLAPTEGTTSGNVYGFCNAGHISNVRTRWLVYTATITDAAGTHTDQGTGSIYAYKNTDCSHPGGNCPAFQLSFNSVPLEVPDDADADGVIDTVDADGGDGSALAGSFLDLIDGRPDTVGSVVDTGGLSVQISDAEDPLGVWVSTGDEAAGPAVLSVCDPAYTVDVAAGTSATVTCGSVDVAVSSGAVTVVVPGGLGSVHFPAGTSGKVDTTAAGGAVVTTVTGDGVTLEAGGAVTPVGEGGSLNLIFGSARNEKLTGTDGDDVIVGNGGNDQIDGKGGSDTILAGSGNDKITTGNGNDTIDAGGGNNNIDAGDGNNTITAGGGNDKITTGNGKDTIDAGGGNNNIDVGAGDDAITAGSGNDSIDGGPGTDSCAPGTGNNKVKNCETIN
jgi:Ca2+-binding RTX toxin-like protein